MRKLNRGDRLLGPVEMRREIDLVRGSLLLGVAAALLFHPTGDCEDKEAEEIQQRIQKKGVEAVVGDLTGWSQDDADLETVVHDYHRLKTQSASSRL